MSQKENNVLDDLNDDLPDNMNVNITLGRNSIPFINTISDPKE